MPRAHVQYSKGHSECFQVEGLLKLFAHQRARGLVNDALMWMMAGGRGWFDAHRPGPSALAVIATPTGMITLAIRDRSFQAAYTPRSQQPAPCRCTDQHCVSCDEGPGLCTSCSDFDIYITSTGTCARGRIKGCAELIVR